MKQKERTVEHAFVVGSKSAMTLAGLDIINLVSWPILGSSVLAACM